jgi:hypothetical protein
MVCIIFSCQPGDDVAIFNKARIAPFCTYKYFTDFSEVRSLCWLFFECPQYYSTASNISLQRGACVRCLLRDEVFWRRRQNLVDS